MRPQVREQHFGGRNTPKYIQADASIANQKHISVLSKTCIFCRHHAEMLVAVGNYSLSLCSCFAARDAISSPAQFYL